MRMALAETRQAAHEGRIRKTAGAYFMDTLKRLATLRRGSTRLRRPSHPEAPAVPGPSVRTAASRTRPGCPSGPLYSQDQRCAGARPPADAGPGGTGPADARPEQSPAA